jgi:branched-chain amino acid transport system ATP-binding protein
MLELRGVHAGYGQGDVVCGVDLELRPGEVVGFLGRNGMGKTSTIRAIMGMIPVREGEVSFGGVSLARKKPFRAARAGIGLVPEGRHVFPTLTVRENLVATARNPAGVTGWTLERVWALFPRLKERERNYGNQLSGGEQQMLAIGRALMTNPRLLILDEATEGLAPLIREEIWRCLARLKAEGQSILVVDKDIKALAALCSRHYILEKGRVAWTGTSAQLVERPDVQRAYLGV